MSRCCLRLRLSFACLAACLYLCIHNSRRERYANQSLPLYSMFCESDVDSKGTTKVDPTAPARSAIRRRRTVRYSPNVRDHQSTLTALLSRSQRRSQSRMRVLEDRRSLLDDIRRQDRSASLSIINPADARNAEAEADLAHSEATQRSRLQSGRALLRDALSYERPGRRPRMSQPTPLPGIPAATVLWRPGDIEDIEASHNSARTNETRSPSARYLPTPSYTSSDTSNRSTSYAPSPLVGTASFTLQVAPAHRRDGEDEAEANAARDEVLIRLSSRMAELVASDEREYIAGHAAQIARMRNLDQATLTPELREQEAAYLDLVEARLDLLRRARGHDMVELPRLRGLDRLTRAMPTPARRRQRHEGSVDGLGDRERSFTPDDDQWETMLTTIPLDDRVPSAHSSFMSATQSSTSTSSNPSSSYGTLLTAPSSNAGMEICPAEYEESEDDPADTFDAQIAQVESQANRIEALSRTLDRQQYREEHLARRRRIFEREQELRQIETNLRRLESQISEERPMHPGLHLGIGGRTGRERL